MKCAFPLKGLFDNQPKSGLLKYILMLAVKVVLLRSGSALVAATKV